MLRPFLTLLSIAIAVATSSGITAKHASAAPPSQGPAGSAARGRALLIGISQYRKPDRAGLFDNLNTNGDVIAIERVATGTFRFPTANIHKLTKPSETTRKGIIKALYLLIRETNVGDTVLIYYAGHGSVAPDPTDPSRESQTLVPSDYSNDGKNDIRDKTLAALLMQLHSRRPKSVTVVFDCCHSATMARSRTAKTRGLGWAQRYPGLPKPPRQIRRTPTSNRRLVPASLPEYVTLGACEDDGEALEMTDDRGQQMGRFTYFLARELSAATAQTTYQAVFDRVEAKMEQRFPDQIPAMEGNASRAVLDGSAVTLPNSYVTHVIADGSLVLRAGLIHGITKGSQFAIYPNDEHSLTDDNRLAVAEVASIGVSESGLKIKTRLRDFGIGDLQGARAVETVHEYGERRLGVNLSEFRMLPRGTELISRLQALDCVRSVAGLHTEPDVNLVWAKQVEIASGQIAEIRRSAAAGTFPVLIRHSDGNVLCKIGDGPNGADELDHVLRREAKSRALRNLDNDKPANPVRVQMRVVHSTVAPSEEWATDVPWPRSERALRPGEWFTIEVRNPSDFDVWISVLELQSDGSSQVLWPGPEQVVTNILPKQQTRWQKLWVGSINRPFAFQATPPFGVQSYKLIATLKKVNLAGLENRRRTNPLEDLLASSLSGTRGPGAVDPGEWATSSACIRVRP